MNIGDNIRKIRKEKGLSMKSLGKIVGVSEQAIGNYERGDREPNIETLNKIAKALGVYTFELMDHLSEDEKKEAKVIFEEGNKMLNEIEESKQKNINEMLTSKIPALAVSYMLRYFECFNYLMHNVSNEDSILLSQVIADNIINCIKLVKNKKNT